MRRWLSCFLILLSPLVFAEQYVLARVSLPGPASKARLLQMGFALEEGAIWSQYGIELILNEREFARLQEAGFRSEILQPDLSSYYAERSRSQGLAPFASGKMGGYDTFSEVLAKLRTYRNKYRSLFSEPLQIGTSVEGRPILAVKISDHVADDEPEEPEVLYTALHHAREPQSLACVLYFMDQLLRRYGKDREITYLVDHRQLWFVPVVNPDGYVYNEQTNPGGGGMWRKNRRINSDGSDGVDLNRNYALGWGIDDQGSSPLGFSEIYRGPNPFSEPETAALRDFVQKRRFVHAFNYHSFRNALLYPWSYRNANAPHDSYFQAMATFLTRRNRYGSGRTFQVLRYTANGEASDWLYAKTQEKNTIFAMTPEVGGEDDGFWPAPGRILPLSKENYEPNIWLARMAGGFPALVGFRGQPASGGPFSGFRPGGKYYLILTLRNLGALEKVPAVTARMTTNHPRATVEAGFASFGNLNPMRSRERKDFLIQISSQAVLGDEIPLFIRIESNGELLRRETFRIYVN